MTTTTHIPSVELLNSTHKFPGPYIFKAIGTRDTGFVARVVAAAREALQMDQDPPHEERTSSGGNHVAVTVTVRVPTPEAVQAVYRRLLSVSGLILLL